MPPGAEGVAVAEAAGDHDDACLGEQLGSADELDGEHDASARRRRGRGRARRRGRGSCPGRRRRGAAGRAHARCLRERDATRSSPSVGRGDRRRAASTSIGVVGDGAEHGDVGSPSDARANRSTSPRRDLDDEAAGRLGEQAVGEVGVGQRRRSMAPSRPAMHISASGDGEAALADVVACARPGRRGSPRAGGGSAPGAPGSGCGRRRRRRPAAPMHEVEVAAGELARRVRRRAGRTSPASLQVGRDARVGVGHVGDGGDHQRRRHGVACAVGAEVLVVQRVLAATRTARRGRRRRRSSRRRRRPARRASTAARGSPHEKLSSRATRSGSAPTATTLRIASSTTAWAIALGVVHAVPRVDADADRRCRASSVGSASTTPSAWPRRRGADQRAHDGGAAGSRGRSGGSTSALEAMLRVGEQRQQRRRRVVDDAAAVGCARSGAGSTAVHRAVAAGRRAGTRCRGRATVVPPWRTTSTPSPVNVAERR